jgi:hypothetical protein
MEILKLTLLGLFEAEANGQLAIIAVVVIALSVVGLAFVHARR